MVPRLCYDSKEQGTTARTGAKATTTTIITTTITTTTTSTPAAPTIAATTSPKRWTQHQQHAPNITTNHTTSKHTEYSMFELLDVCLLEF